MPRTMSGGMIALAVFVVIVSCPTQQVCADTIDFSSYSVWRNDSSHGVIISDGFWFESDFIADMAGGQYVPRQAQSDYPNPPTTAFMQAWDSSTDTPAGPFSLVSFDMRDLTGAFSAAPYTDDVTVVGAVASGGYVSMTISPTSQYQTYSLTGSGWNNLTGVWFEAYEAWDKTSSGWEYFGSIHPLALDNIVVGAAVPLPAAAWLGLGLLATLGAVRRIRRRRAA